MSLSRLPENTEEKKFLIDYYKSLTNTDLPPRYLSLYGDDESNFLKLDDDPTDKELMEKLTLYKTKDNTYILRAE